MRKTRTAGAAIGLALVGLTVGAGLYLGGAIAQEKKDALPPDLQRVPRDATLFVRVRVGDLWTLPELKKARDKFLKESPDVADNVESSIGVGPEEVDRLTFIVTEPAGNTQPVLAVATSRPYSRKAVLANAAAGAEEKKVGDNTIWVPERGNAFHFIDEHTFLTAPAGELQTMLDKLNQRTEEPLLPALKLAAGKQTVVAGLNVARIAKILPPNLPPEVAPFKSLLQAEVALLTAEAGTTLRAHAEAAFGKDSEAKDAGDAVGALMTLGRLGLSTFLTQLKQDEKSNAAQIMLVQLGAEALKSGKVAQDGSRLQVDATATVDLAQLSTALESTSRQVRLAAMRAQSQNNLKQLALAMHNYHDTFGAFPPVAVFDKAGKPLLGWRVLILPFVEGDALYKEFHLDEPWDSEHNRKLLAKMPPVFQHPADKRGTNTRYLSFTGPGTLYEGKRGLKLFNILDGTSNTLMVVEADKEVPWSKPEDLPYDPKKLPKLSGLFPEGANAAFCDGSVRLLRNKIKDDVLNALITIKGGEVINPNDL